MADAWLIYSDYFEYTGQEIPKFMLDSFQESGVNAQILYPQYFSSSGNELLYKDKFIELPKICLFRCQNFNLAGMLENKGVRVINQSKTIKLVRDKIKTHTLLQNFDISQPKFLSYNGQDYDFLVNALGTPFILKDNFGKQGKGVFLISSKKEFDTVIGEFQKKEFEAEVLCQEFISLSSGQDIRFYIIDNAVSAAGKRINENDFRSNIALGGMGELYKPSKSEVDLALKIARILNLEVGSVDFLIRNDELVFCEANTSSGFSMFYQFDINMNDKITEYVLKFLK